MQPVASWADLVTLVTLPGPAILDAVRLVRRDAGKPIGALLVAQMSSKGEKKIVKWASKSAKIRCYWSLAKLCCIVMTYLSRQTMKLFYVAYLLALVRIVDSVWRKELGRRTGRRPPSPFWYQGRGVSSLKPLSCRSHYYLALINQSFVSLINVRE